MAAKAGLCRLALLMSLAAASPSQAAIKSYDFSISGDFFGVGSPPFGLTSNPVLTGRLGVDLTKNGRDAIASLAFSSGTRDWSTSDLTPESYAAFFGGDLDDFALVFTGGDNYVYAYNTASFSENGGFLSCNNCVSFRPSADGVPEPAAWAMMIAGFAMLGGMTRSRAAGVRRA